MRLSKLTVVMVTAAPLFACPQSRTDDYYDPPNIPGQRPDAAKVVPPGNVGPAPAPTTPPGDAAPPAVDTDSTPGADAPTHPQAADEPARLGQVPSFAALFRELSPSVVSIYTQEVLQRRDLQARRFGFLPEQFGTALGSGIVLDVQGHILTNAHVVENARETRVRFHDETEAPARLIGIDPVRDLALLKVDGASGLRPVVPGDSDALEVGDWVIAIGNPYGRSHTVTKGIVSGRGRNEFVNDRVGYLDLIQTDAAVNQGNSGGPLFDMNGHVVGVNTAINAEGQGISFAIQWKVVEDALPRLMQGDPISRSWLGVYLIPGDEPSEGVLIDAIVEDSPAARARLQPGDVIIALDGHPTRHVAEFRLRIASAVAGREMPITVLRSGERLNLVARLEEARDIR